MRLIELLAPAKDYDAVRAAVDCGADAVYMGGAQFGARVGATNSVEDIARAVEYAHQYKVRLYATLNTLLFESELEQARRVALDMVAAGIDALIVQDLALARMELGVELHASTQMCNATPEGVKFLSDLGFRRVVMERNLSLAKINEIAAAAPDVDMEVFVHGAICVGYSGECLLSRSMNPERSGNRGACSQPCRMSYDLCTASGERLLQGRHLLSVKDMNLSERVGDLLDAGVHSLKIEGRLKDLSYTKNIVSHYRRVVDAAIAEREGLCRSSLGRTTLEFTPNPAKSFSRGETTYMLDGQQRGVASFDTPKSMGESVGVVRSLRGEVIEVVLNDGVTLSTGDGICYVANERLEGSNINMIDGVSRITLSRRGGLRVGTQLYRNFDRRFELAVNGSRTRRAMDVVGRIVTTPHSITVEYRDEEGLLASAVVEGSFEAANNREKMEQTISQQLAKCGDTIFNVTHIDTSDWGGEFITAGQLSAARREALDTLRQRRIETKIPNEIFTERMGARYRAEVAHTTNSLAEQLYRDHGAKSIAPSEELLTDYTGVEVLRSNYCIRNEIGECLKRGSQLSEELYIERGGARYRLCFDCAKCQMSLVKC